MKQLPRNRKKKPSSTSLTRRRDRDPVALRAWVERWQTSGRILRRMRHEALRRMTTRQVQEAILSFNDAFADALRRFPHRTSSGLVAQQELFRHLVK
jgi:hypothetical protein